MKRKTVVRIHLVATIIAVVTIATFFTISLIAEIRGDQVFIKAIKALILYALPLMIFAMPCLAITGNKLAGKSKNALVEIKKKRMKFVMLNGIILVSLAIFLYYRSHFQSIDGVFLTFQIAEFVFGLTNLSMIILNARNGMQLSGKLKRRVSTEKLF
mgnify:FL=1